MTAMHGIQALLAWHNQPDSHSETFVGFMLGLVITMIALFIIANA